MATTPTTHLTLDQAAQLAIPHAHAVAASATSIWVANASANTADVIDPATNTTVTQIPVGTFPYSISIADGKVWVASIGDPNAADPGLVTVIDDATRTVLATFTVGQHPTHILATPDAVFVANNTAGTVSIIDPHTYAVTATIPVAGTVAGLTADAGMVWVGYNDGPDGTDPTVSVNTDHATTRASGLAVIDITTRQIVTRLAVGANIDALTAGAGRIVAASSDGPLYVVDAASRRLITTLSVGAPGLAAGAVSVTTSSDPDVYLTAGPPGVTAANPRTGFTSGLAPVVHANGIVVAFDSVWVTSFDGTLTRYTATMRPVDPPDTGGAVRDLHWVPPATATIGTNVTVSSVDPCPVAKRRPELASDPVLVHLDVRDNLADADRQTFDVPVAADGSWTATITLGASFSRVTPPVALSWSASCWVNLSATDPALKQALAFYSPGAGLLVAG